MLYLLCIVYVLGYAASFFLSLSFSLLVRGHHRTARVKCLAQGNNDYCCGYKLQCCICTVVFAHNRLVGVVEY